jgi:hypothetical protein
MESKREGGRGKFPGRKVRTLSSFYGKQERGRKGKISWKKSENFEFILWKAREREEGENPREASSKSHPHYGSKEIKNPIVEKESSCSIKKNSRDS